MPPRVAYWLSSFDPEMEAIASEVYPYPSLPGLTNPLQRLEQAAESVAFAQFLRDNHIDIDFSWINRQPAAFVRYDKYT